MHTSPITLLGNVYVKVLGLLSRRNSMSVAIDPKGLHMQIPVFVLCSSVISASPASSSSTAIRPSRVSGDIRPNLEHGDENIADQEISIRSLLLHGAPWPSSQLRRPRRLLP
jgi:hypothetical protein